MEYIVLIIAAFVTIGVIVGLIVYVVDMFTSHRRPKKQPSRQKKNKRA
jgi:hypothetical protein